jgi:hypothetical protein
MAKAKARSTLPLDDPRWWSFDCALQYRRRQICDDILATQDIRLAVEHDRLPAKIELYNQRIGARVSQLLPSWFFRCQFQITLFIGPNGNRLGAYPHTLMRRGGWDYKNLKSPTFFVWRPKVEELWPERVATQAMATETISAPAKQQQEIVELASSGQKAIPTAEPPKGVTERFVYEWMRDHPPYKGEDNYAQKRIFPHRPDKRVKLKRIRNLVGQYRSEFEIERNPFPRGTSPRSRKR